MSRSIAVPGGERPAEVLAFLHDTTFADLPHQVVEFGRRCLLDLLGVAAAGRTTELSRIIGNHAAAHFGPGTSSATLWFDGRQVSPAGAALANGMTIDSVDAHDGNKFTKGHTGCHQLPTLLAIAEAEGMAADEGPSQSAHLLASLIVGYEIATRAGFALHDSVSDYHTSGAWGAVGSAALGARLLGLDHQQTFHAMGIAEYHGPRSQMMRVIDHPTMLKDGSGWGAMTGVSAAYLAADGFTGAPAITVSHPEVRQLWDDLGQRWVILEQYFKPHPVCRWAQPAVEAALTLCRTHRVSAEQVAAVHIETFHEAARLAGAHPNTTEAAQYSLVFPVAAAVVRGQLGPQEVNDDGLGDQQIHAMADLVTIAEDPAHNAAFPGNRYARVTIECSDGRRIVSDDTEPRGDPEAHLSDEEIRAKFRSYAPLAMQAESADALEAVIDGLPSSGSLTQLLGLIRHNDPSEGVASR